MLFGRYSILYVLVKHCLLSILVTIHQYLGHTAVLSARLLLREAW